MSLSIPSNLCSKNKVIISQISNSDNQAKSPIPLINDCLVAEDDCFAPISWSGKFRKDQTNHECLNDASKNSLKHEKSIILLLVNIDSLPGLTLPA